MLHIFSHPDQSQTDLRILDKFRDWIKQSSLPHNTKNDALRIIESLRWVKSNLDSIKEFVSNKDRYLPHLPESDRANGVIRDHMGTSIHFNSYSNGDRAIHDLSELINVFENTFISLTESGHENFLALSVFVSKCEYDKDRGCLEARVANATEFAGMLRSSNNKLRLNDLLQIAQLHFVNIEDDNAYNFIMAEQFFSPFYQQMILDDNGQAVPLTEELVFAALENTLCYTKPDDAKLSADRVMYQTDFNRYQAHIFSKLTQHATQMIGGAGMIQYRFKHKERAEELSKWLKRCNSLQAYGIERCRATEEKGEFVVRLTPEQRSIIDFLPAKRETLETDREHFIRKLRITNQARVEGILLHDAVINYSSNEFETFINKASSEAISHALVIKDVIGETPLHLAISKQDSAGLQALIAKASPEAINQVLLIENKNGETPLHLAIYKQDGPAFPALIAKASPESINQTLVIKDKYGLTPLHLAALLNGVIFQELIAKASSEAINQALLIKNKWGKTLLHTAASEQDSTAFQALVAKASPEAINQALLTKNPNEDTPLHLAAFKQDSAAVQTLIAKASAESINQVLLIKNTNENTPLHLALEKQDSATVQALINKASTEVINQTLLITNKSNGETPLLVAAYKQDSSAFQALIAKASPETINQALIINNKHEDTPLHAAAYAQDSIAFQALIAKASPEAINRALVIDKSGATPLYAAAYDQDSVAFQALIAKASAESISQALVIKKFGETPLHVVVNKQDSATIQALINKASPKAISKALVIKNMSGQTPLHLAADKQDSAIFQALIAKASPEALNQALLVKDKNGETLLHLAARKQDSATFQALIAKASPNALKHGFFPCLDNERQLGNCEATMLKGIKNQADLTNWVMLLLKVSNRLAYWPEGVPFFDKPTFLEQTKSIQQPQIKRLIEAISDKFTLNDDSTNIFNIAIGGNTYRLSPKSSKEELLALVKAIKFYGLGSWTDFYLLQDYKNTHPDGKVFNEVLTLIDVYGELDAFLFKSFPSEPILSEIASQGHLAMKMFSGWQPQAWPNFLKQLETPQVRASLRKERTPAKETHKLDLLTGEISVYKGKEKRSKLHHDSHAKKQSATLISTQKHTPLFQSHDTSKRLVGIALRVDPDLITEKSDKNRAVANIKPYYKKDLAKIRAMMLYDTGTYNRSWVGSEDEVNHYAAKVKKYSSLEEFHAVISHENSKTNEVLLEPSKGSLLSIVIGRDEPEERALAIKYQQDVKDELGIELPIFLYEPSKQLLISLEKHDLINKYKSLNKEKTDLLLQTVTVERNSFFNSNAQYNNRTYPKKIIERIIEIDVAISHLIFPDLYSKFPKLNQFNLNHSPKRLLQDYASFSKSTWRHHKDLIAKLLTTLDDSASYRTCLEKLETQTRGTTINKEGTLYALMQLFTERMKEEPHAHKDGTWSSLTP